MKLQFIYHFFGVMFIALISGASLGQTATRGINTDGSLTFSVLTVTNNATYSPRNVLAIWVKDSQGNFVISRKVMAATRKQHLVKWVASSNNNVVNATTGATLPNHQQHNISWDCRDAAGNLVPDGLYEIWIEFTERNSASGGAVGPSTKVAFTKGTDVVTISPPDEAYFKNMSLTYSPLNVGIDESLKSYLKFNAFPNPFTERLTIGFELPVSSFINTSVYDANGKRVVELVNQTLPQGNNTFWWDGNLNDSERLKPGVYFIRVSYRNKLFVQKVIFSN